MDGMLFKRPITINSHPFQTCSHFFRGHGTAIKSLGIVLEGLTQFSHKLLVIKVLGPVSLNQVIKLFLNQRVLNPYILCACKAVPCLDVVLAEIRTGQVLQEIRCHLRIFTLG